jgi:outer membrane protein
MKRIFMVAVFFSFAGAVIAGELLTLEESIETALANNLQVNVSSEMVKQAEYSREEAFTFFLPKLSSSFTYTRLDEEQVMEFGGMPFIVADANLYNFGLALSQPLYTGGRLRAVYLQAKENIQRTEFERQTVVQNLSFDVKKGYFSILKAKRGVQTVNSLKDMAQEHLKIAETLFKEGLVTKMDVLKTEVFLADTEQQIIQAENSLALSKSSFSFLLNQPLSSEFEVEDVLERRKGENSFEYWTELSYQQRPELRAVESVVKVYGYNIETEKSGYMPQVFLFGNYLWDRGSQSPVDEWQNSWNVGLALEFDIWNWGETRYRVQKARHQKKEIENQYALLKKSIELEVRAAYLNLETAGKQIESSKKSMEKAEENLRVTDILYREGMVTTADVLEAQTSLTTAINKYYQALYDYQIAYAELEKSAGVVRK